MRFEGIHHITAITGDAQRNVDFYADTLGLRLVKKTVNQDDPTVYHLFYADERGSAGSDITFFEYPGALPGRAGDGMVYRVVWRVGSAESLGFWAERLGVERAGETLLFTDPEGLEHELIVDASGDEPLTAEHPDIPEEHRLRGFAGVRAYSSQPERSAAFLEALGFTPPDPLGVEHASAAKPRASGVLASVDPHERTHALRTEWEARGEQRSGFYAYDPPPAEPPRPSAGTIHHVAWGSKPDEHEQWRERVLRAGGRPTPVIERFYFKSIYFREPSGVLFEIATLGPGFTADEPLETLGEALSLPPNFEHLRPQVEQVLTPIRNPRDAWARR